MNEIILPGSAIGASEQRLRGEINLPRIGRSLLWLLLFIFMYFFGAALYFLAVGVAFGFQNPELASDAVKVQAMMGAHGKSPSGIASMYLTQFCLLMPALFLAAHFETQSWRETLGIKRFSIRILGFWLLLLAAYLLMQSLINGAFDIAPTGFLQSVTGSRSLGLTLVMIVIAPVMEELILRGYLFKAWRYSRLGLAGTLLLTSLLFVGLHWGQYHWSLLAFLFLLSVILGLAREKSGSVWVPVILHGANNFVSAILVVYRGLAT